MGRCLDNGRVLQELLHEGARRYANAVKHERLSFTHYTQPEPELKLLLDKLKLTLPAQAPPKIAAQEAARAAAL